jgi:predicted metal-dependent hydrolase
MSSLLRLLLTKSDASGTRNIQRDTVALAMDDGSHVEVMRVRDPRARRLRLSVDERGARLTLPPRASAISGERFLEQHRDWVVTQLRAHAIDDLVAPLARDDTTALPLRGVMVPLRITGAWADPTYRLDLESIAREKMEAEAKEVEARAKAELEARLKEQLGVEAQGEERLEDAAKRRAREALEKEAGKLLQGILGAN